jgi:hypothetical protein
MPHSATEVVWSRKLGKNEVPQKPHAVTKKAGGSSYDTST